MNGREITKIELKILKVTVLSFILLSKWNHPLGMSA
jgi:hypothetical protein